MPPNLSNAPHSMLVSESQTKHLETKKHSVVGTPQNREDDEVTLKEWKSDISGWFRFEQDLIWVNIISIALLHIGCVYALLTYNWFSNPWTSLWVYFLGLSGGFGVTGGAHRYWTHRSYKANLPLQIFLVITYLIAAQIPIRDWVRDHRVHHKYSETEADPHNSHRGFFFAHVGWLMMKKHPEVLRRGKQIDMSDIENDPVIQFVDKHFTILKILVGFVIPICIPVYFWNDGWYITILTQVFLRYPFILNSTWSVNSFAHIWGSRSYDKTLHPAENHFVAFVALGEGWHNYHHVFPWDYKASELGNYGLNGTTAVIDAFARIGWAYDLKHPSEDLVRKIVENRGDGTHPKWSKLEK